MTSREFMADDIFKKCCDKAKVKITKRQASKFRRETGRAYKALPEVQKESEVK